jgi:uncharacterized protein
MSAIPLPLASPLATAFVRLGEHRVLSLRDENVAILSENSTGWCVLTRDDYRRLCGIFAQGPLRLGDLPNGSDAPAMATLWEAGLLLADGSPHPSTRRKRDRYPSALLLKLTGACNLECTYCYDFEESRFKARLSFEKVREAIDYLLEHREQLSITFHGGEPLLRFQFLRQIVEYAVRQANDRDRVRFSIQTNATLFTDEIVSFLVENNFSVGISLDGVGEAANRLRPGHGRSRSLWEHADHLFTAYPKFVRERCGFLAVASRTSAPALPFFALWLQEQGVAGLTITFLDLVGRGKNLAAEKLTPDEAVDLNRQFAVMIKLGQIRELALRSLLSRIHNLFTFQPRDFCHKGPCGASGEFLVLDAEGKYRTCDCIYHPYFELGQDVTSLDNSLGHTAREEIHRRHEWLRNSGPSCSKCPLFGLCGGTCVAKAIAGSGRDHSVDPIECAITRWIYPELLNEFAGNSEMPLLSYYRLHKHQPLPTDAYLI